MFRLTILIITLIGLISSSLVSGDNLDSVVVVKPVADKRSRILSANDNDQDDVDVNSQVIIKPANGNRRLLPDDQHDNDQDDDDLDSAIQIKPVGRLLDEVTNGTQGSVEKLFFIGKRVTGDRVVGHVASDRHWEVPHNITARFTYPREGEGANITYCATLLKVSRGAQKSIRVGKGGVGQRQISIIVRATNTRIFRHRTQVFGLE